MNRFLEKNGYRDAQPLAQDGSARSYARVSKGANTALLMQMGGENAAVELRQFVAIADWLRDIGLSAPEIYVLDEAQHMAIIEDFGGEPFKGAPDYDLCADVLAHMQSVECPLDLPAYKDGLVHKGRSFVLDYYLPASLGRARTDEELEAYNAAWDEIESNLPLAQQGVVHGDYHVENLLWLRDRHGLKRCGIIDFQDMMRGPVAYDICNLLWDMRTDVTEETRRHILQRYDSDTQAWARVLAAQFHCRLIGQCVRWAVKTDKPQYMRFLPRIQGYLLPLLAEDIFTPLRTYFSDIGLDFNAPEALDMERAREFIRADAF